VHARGGYNKYTISRGVTTHLRNVAEPEPHESRIQLGVKGRSMMHARLSKHVVGVVDLGAWNERPGSGPQAGTYFYGAAAREKEKHNVDLPLSMWLEHKLDEKQQDLSLNNQTPLKIRPR
jgi:hypothetical protein